MKLDKDCITCLGRIVDHVSSNLNQDPQMKGEVIRRGHAVLQEAFRPDKCPPWLVTRVLEETSSMTGVPDPYESVRQKEMAAAKEIFRRIRPMYGDDFRSAVELAVLGNNLDFYRGPGDLEASLSEDRGRGLTFHIDHIERTKRKLNLLKKETVVFLADNAGEVFFDAPLLEKITSLGLRVFYGVKERPFVNDLTWRDLERTDMLSQIPGVLSTGTGALLDLSSLSQVFREELETCNLIISKGQANYECLTELPIKKDIFYLLKAKCQPIRKTLNVPLNSYIALLAEPSGV